MTLQHPIRFSFLIFFSLLLVHILSQSINPYCLEATNKLIDKSNTCFLPAAKGDRGCPRGFEGDGKQTPCHRAVISEPLNLSDIELTKHMIDSPIFGCSDPTFHYDKHLHLCIRETRANYITACELNYTPKKHKCVAIFLAQALCEDSSIPVEKLCPVTRSVPPKIKCGKHFRYDESRANCLRTTKLPPAPYCPDGFQSTVKSHKSGMVCEKQIEYEVFHSKHHKVKCDGELSKDKTICRETITVPPLTRCEEPGSYMDGTDCVMDVRAKAEAKCPPHYSLSLRPYAAYCYLKDYTPPTLCPHNYELSPEDSTCVKTDYRKPVPMCPTGFVPYEEAYPHKKKVKNVCIKRETDLPMPFCKGKGFFPYLSDHHQKNQLQVPKGLGGEVLCINLTAHGRAVNIECEGNATFDVNDFMCHEIQVVHPEFQCDAHETLTFLADGGMSFLNGKDYVTCEEVESSYHSGDRSLEELRSLNSIRVF